MHELDRLTGLIDEGNVGKPNGLGQGLSQQVGLLLASGNVDRCKAGLLDLGDEEIVGKVDALGAGRSAPGMRHCDGNLVVDVDRRWIVTALVVAEV